MHVRRNHIFAFSGLSPINAQVFADRAKQHALSFTARAQSNPVSKTKLRFLHTIAESYYGSHHFFGCYRIGFGYSDWSGLPRRHPRAPIVQRRTKSLSSG